MRAMTDRDAFPTLRVMAYPAPRAETSNPYVNLLYNSVPSEAVTIHPWSQRRLVMEPWDVVHVHWPEYLASRGRFRALTVLLALRIARRRGAILAWTAHNAGPHEGEGADHWFLQRFSRQVDLLLLLAPSSIERLRQVLPRLNPVNVAVTPHGHYRDFYATATSILDRPSISYCGRKPTLLCVGRIRPYKNLPAVAGTVTAAGLRVVIAGAVDDYTIAEELQRRATGCDDLVLEFGYASEERIATLHDECDLVILLYTGPSVLNSGAAMLALSLNRPVLMSDGPSTRDLMAAVGAEWVYPCQPDGSDLVRIARKALSDPRSEAPDLHAFAWESVGRATLAAFRDGLQASQSRERRR